MTFVEVNESHSNENKQSTFILSEFVVERESTPILLCLTETQRQAEVEEKASGLP